MDARPKLHAGAAMPRLSLSLASQRFRRCEEENENNNNNGAENLSLSPSSRKRPSFRSRTQPIPSCS